MNITRVERDGVEFFTIDETGESGMSESGLACLCGVAPSSVYRFITSSALRWDHEKTLDPKFRKTISFCATNGGKSSSSQKSNLKILSATVCARTIEHFAFESKHKTEEALFAYRKFAVKGMNAWIQDATHWHGNAVPRTGIVLDYNTIETLLENKLDATAYRVYLVLQKAIRMRVQLSALEIMEQAKISRSGYSTAIGKLADANLLPEWCSIKRKRHPERDVRDRLQSQLGGQVEAYTRYGLIDLLTATELIEIKTVDRWKDAVGHILAKAHRYPNHAKRLHLFSSEEPILETIEQVCTPHNIRVTYEKVDRPKLNPSNSKSI
jgi:hypothetical protein